MSENAKLLRKEIKLAASPLSYFFLSFTLMAFIPGYPILVSQFFICLGLFQTFQSGREANDIIYSVLLPIPKKSIVKARFIFVLFIELIDFILILIFSLIRMGFMSELSPYAANPLLNANFFFVGFSLLVLALFNLIFVRGYFKTGYYFARPFIAFIVIAFFIVAASEVLHYLPGLSYISTAGFDELTKQLIFLATSIIIFILLTLWGEVSAEKSFDKLDL